jgi:HK97 family phage prohead protease
MEFNPAMFVKPVEGDSELVAFTYGFGLAPEGKAGQPGLMEDATVTELDDGDLLIEGYAADFTGVDREGENFAPGAFERGLKSFLGGQSALCYHHDSKAGIGKVLDLKEIGDKLFMRARVDKQEPTSPLHYIYNGIKKGSYRGLSAGGFFKRALTEAGRRIVDVDLTEFSVTPVPVHPGTGFNVVAGKALDVGEKPEEDAETLPVEELQRASAALTQLTETLETKALPRNHDPMLAQWVTNFIKNVGVLREFSTEARNFGEHEDVTSLADEIESSAVKWEAVAHKLAAKHGPVPVPVQSV